MYLKSNYSKMAFIPKTFQVILDATKAISIYRFLSINAFFEKGNIFTKNYFKQRDISETYIDTYHMKKRDFIDIL